MEDGGAFLQPLKNRQDIFLLKSCMNVAAGIVILTSMGSFIGLPPLSNCSIIPVVSVYLAWKERDSIANEMHSLITLLLVRIEKSMFS